MKYILISIVLGLSACSSGKYYIVRHAEKAVVTKDTVGMMASNPPLSEPGKVRAFCYNEQVIIFSVRQVAGNIFPTGQCIHDIIYRIRVTDNKHISLQRTRFRINVS